MQKLKLIGSYFSPYTRRVAISLNALGMPYEFVPVSVLAEQDKVRVHNPVVRVPVLVLPEGEALIESHAILDEVDQMARPDKALIPRQGASRRAVMQTTALAVACMEKAQWAFYEGRFRPASMIHQPWVDHNDRQVLGGLQRLEEIANSTSGEEWLAGTATISQADITTAVVFGSIQTLRSNLNVAGYFPRLGQFADRCEALEIFRKAPAPPLGPAPPLPTA
jgi:glutathione S-transferase